MTPSEPKSPIEAPEEQRGGIDCVFLTCFASEFSFLALLLRYSSIRLHRAETMEEADFLLLVTGATAFLSDVTFLDGACCDALRMCADKYPSVGSLVVADAADRPFLGGIYSCGACGVLWKPIDVMCAIDSIRTIHQAALDRQALFAESRRAPLVVGTKTPWQ